MATEACPNSSCTNFGWMFFWNRRDAQVCRRSWKVILGKSARFRRGTKDCWRKLDGLMRLPLSLAKSRPRYWYRPPALSFFLCLPCPVATLGFYGP